VADAAHLGCLFTTSNNELHYIPNTIRSKKELAGRVNAHTGTMFRLNQQTAGELVDALFHVRVVRDRTINKDGKTVQTSYYTFNTDTNGMLQRKTLADYVNEYGVDGAAYERAFMERVREEAARQHTARIQAERAESEAGAELMCGK
jgi:hypothetical protein